MVISASKTGGTASTGGTSGSETARTASTRSTSGLCVVNTAVCALSMSSLNIAGFRTENTAHLHISTLCLCSVLQIGIRYSILLILAVSRVTYCEYRLYSGVFRGAILRVLPVLVA